MHFTKINFFYQKLKVQVFSYKRELTKEDHELEEHLATLTYDQKQEWQRNQVVTYQIGHPCKGRVALALWCCDKKWQFLC